MIKSDKKATILVVDDEESILRATKSILRREFNVVTFKNPLEVVEYIDNHDIDVIISDEMMPEMRGSDLVSIIHKKKPNICTIILSGHSNKENIARAINQGHIFSFLFKPADNIQLIQTIKRGLENKIMRERIVLQNKELSKYNKDLESIVKKRTTQIVSMEKFYEIGKFSASIVHNLNNPLQTMIMATELIELDMHNTLKPGSSSFRYIHMINESLDSLEKMIKSITFSVKDSTYNKTEKFNINTVINTVLEYFKIDHDFKHNTKINLDLDQNLPLYNGKDIHFNQIISNLIKNAIDAMEDKKEKILSISTSFNDKFIFLKISDTGIGIKQEDIDTIFNTGFTTKSSGKGTGLGLSITKQMVESYKGTISVNSETEKGASFSLKFPIK